MGGQHVLLVQPILTRDPVLPLPAYHVILMKSVPLDRLLVLNVRQDLAVLLLPLKLLVLHLPTHWKGKQAALPVLLDQYVQLQTRLHR